MQFPRNEILNQIKATLMKSRNNKKALNAEYIILLFQYRRCFIERKYIVNLMNSRNNLAFWYFS